MSRRRYEPDHFQIREDGQAIVRMVCRGQTKRKGGHKCEVLAYVVRDPEPLVIDGREVGGLRVEYPHGTGDNAFRDAKISTAGEILQASHMTYRFCCSLCKLDVPLSEDRLREIVDSAIRANARDVPLDRRD